MTIKLETKNELHRIDCSVALMLLSFFDSRVSRRAVIGSHFPAAQQASCEKARLVYPHLLYGMCAMHMLRATEIEYEYLLNYR
jgi:hypothetical protein